MNNMMKSVTKMQWGTLLGIVAYLLWEFYFLAEWKAQTVGPLIRVDLVIIFPLLLIGIAIPLIQFLRKNLRYCLPKRCFPLLIPSR